MSERPCGLCTRPVADAKVCTRCRDTFERDIGDVDALDEQLEIVLTRQTAYTERNGPRSSAHPIPVDLRASEAAWLLRNTLTTWCRELGWADTQQRAINGAERPATAGPRCRHCDHHSCRAIRGDVTNSALSTWLLRHAEDIRHHDAADECMAEIGAAVSEVRKVVDAPANRTTFPVGPCPERSEAGDCPGEIRAYIPADERPCRMECTVDPDHLYEPWQWTRAGQRIMRKKALRA